MIWSKLCKAFNCHSDWMFWTLLSCDSILSIIDENECEKFCGLDIESSILLNSDSVIFSATCVWVSEGLLFKVKCAIFIRPSLRRDVLWYTNVRLSVHPSVCPSVRPFHMSRSNLRTPWPIHFKFHRVIGIDGLMVCILYGEILNFHSRVMRLYSSNCRRFFVCRAVNWEPLGQFPSNFA